MTREAPAIDAVLETALYADDLEAARRFYEGVLGFEVHGVKAGVFVFFRLRRAMLLIFDPKASGGQPFPPSHGAKGPGHVCFRVAETALEYWRERLEHHEVAIELEHRWPNGALSIYVRDPAGNSVEFAPARLWDLEDA